MMPERVSRQLVYLVYGGKPEYHQEAKYSILSALYHAQGACPRIPVSYTHLDVYKRQDVARSPLHP